MGESVGVIGSSIMCYQPRVKGVMRYLVGHQQSRVLCDLSLPH